MMNLGLRKRLGFRRALLNLGDAFFEDNDGPPYLHGFLRGKLADGSYVVLRGLNSNEIYEKLSGKVS